MCPFASRFQNSHWDFRNKEDSPWFDHLSHHAKLAEIINMVGKYMNKTFSNLSKSDIWNCKFGFNFNCEEVDLQLNYMNIIVVGALHWTLNMHIMKTHDLNLWRENSFYKICPSINSKRAWRSPARTVAVGLVWWGRSYTVGCVGEQSVKPAPPKIFCCTCQTTTKNRSHNLPSFVLLV